MVLAAAQSERVPRGERKVSCRGRPRAYTRLPGRRESWLVGRLAWGRPRRDAREPGRGRRTHGALKLLLKL